MKTLINIHMQTCILELIDQKAKDLNISRAALIRAAVCDSLGVPHNELEPKNKKELVAKTPRVSKPHRAIANGVYLGSFETAEEAEKAKRDATRRTFYLFQHVEDGLITFTVPEEITYEEDYWQIDVFKYHNARLKDLREFVENNSGKFKNKTTAQERIGEALSELFDELTTDHGCEVKAVVA